MLTRAEDETVTRWSTRAVESVLGYTTPPNGLDARFAQLAITVHCSHCGDAYEGEDGPMWFTPEQLPKLADYALDESGWVVNLNGLRDDEVGSRGLVCSRCLSAGWCEVCDEPIRAWQHVSQTTDVGVVHEGCTDQATTVTRPNPSEVPQHPFVPSGPGGTCGYAFDPEFKHYCGLPPTHAAHTFPNSSGDAS